MGTATFHLFPKLPKEIRLEIWRCCIPQRVVELDIDQRYADYGIPWQAEMAIYNANALPPCVTRVCSEARAVAFETGSMQKHPFIHGIDHQRDDFDPNEWPDWLPEYNRWLWVDSRRDVAVCHYSHTTDQEVEQYEYPGDPIQYLIHHAKHLKVAKPIVFSFLIEQFEHLSDPSEGGHTKSSEISRAFSAVQSSGHPPSPYLRWSNYRWSTRELADIMLTSARWTVIVLFPIYVAVWDGHSTGLFGLLDDAPVQVVDASDSATLETYLSLGDIPGVELSEQVSVTAVNEAFLRAKEAITWLFRCHDKEPIFEPAVMFRLHKM